MIELRHISKSFGDQHLLQDISFRVQPGERVSLLGPGGCGKTTLLKIILGLIPPDEGDVFVMEKSMVHGNDHEKRLTLREVGVAFQQGALFDFMTIRENITFAMEHMRDYSHEVKEQKIKSLLAGVKMGHTENMFPYELSGGMQRRVGIVRALATEPLVALFDEPTAGLDPVTSTIILNMILNLAQNRDRQDNRRSLLVSTSNVEIAIRFAERILVIHEGKLVCDGLWRDLILTGPEWVQHFLSVRLVGLDKEYAHELQLPESFIARHWK